MLHVLQDALMTVHSIKTLTDGMMNRSYDIITCLYTMKVSIELDASSETPSVNPPSWSFSW